MAAVEHFHKYKIMGLSMETEGRPCLKFKEKICFKDRKEKEFGKMLCFLVPHLNSPLAGWFTKQCNAMWETCTGYSICVITCVLRKCGYVAHSFINLNF